MIPSRLPHWLPVFIIWQVAGDAVVTNAWTTCPQTPGLIIGQHGQVTALRRGTCVSYPHSPATVMTLGSAGVTVGRRCVLHSASPPYALHIITKIGILIEKLEVSKQKALLRKIVGWGVVDLSGNGNRKSKTSAQVGAGSTKLSVGGPEGHSFVNWAYTPVRYSPASIYRER